MGIETSAEHDGAQMSFMAAIIAVEGESVSSSFSSAASDTSCSPCTELAKVDPSISVMCDVHNTLVNSTLRLYGNEDVQARFLPRLATNTVSTIPQ